MQERSRQTVRRILAAAEAIVEQDGVDAATTRAIAERANVAVPSLYRFFADRDEILDALLEEMLRDLDEQAEEAERSFTGESIEEFVGIEMELHVAYYERHPSLVRLWFEGRVSPAVVELVRARNRALAARARRMLGRAGMLDPAVPELALDLLVEYGDRTLDMAFRGRRRADRAVIETGIAALCAIAESWQPPGAGEPPGATRPRLESP